MLHADYANMYLPEAFHYMYPKMFFGGFEGEYVYGVCVLHIAKEKSGF